MPHKILQIDHHDNPRDDLASIHLESLGFELELCCPFKGDTLPTSLAPYRGAVIYGGSQNVTETDQYAFLNTEIEWLSNAIEIDFPVLGICLGAQLIAHCLGAKVGYHNDGLCEFGYYRISSTNQANGWIPESMYVTQAHYQCFDLPEGATLLATGEHFPNQAFRYGKNIVGMQFHPEVTADVFRRWQDADWAFYDKPGAQSRAIQSQLLESADAIQGAWFMGFLETFFGVEKPGRNVSA